VFVFGFLVFKMGVVGLLCRDHSQVIGWKVVAVVPKITKWDVKLYTLTHWHHDLCQAHRWFIYSQLCVQVARFLANPLCRGVFAGDSSVLSMRSCCPIFYDLEQNFASIIIGSLFRKKGWSEYFL